MKNSLSALITQEPYPFLYIGDGVQQKLSGQCLYLWFEKQPSALERRAVEQWLFSDPQGLFRGTCGVPEPLQMEHDWFDHYLCLYSDSSDLQAVWDGLDESGENTRPELFAIRVREALVGLHQRQPLAFVFHSRYKRTLFSPWHVHSLSKGFSLIERVGQLFFSGAYRAYEFTFGSGLTDPFQLLDDVLGAVLRADEIKKAAPGEREYADRLLAYLMAHEDLLYEDQLFRYYTFRKRLSKHTDLDLVTTLSDIQKSKLYGNVLAGKLKVSLETEAILEEANQRVGDELRTRHAEDLARGNALYEAALKAYEES